MRLQSLKEHRTQALPRSTMRAEHRPESLALERYNPLQFSCLFEGSLFFFAWIDDYLNGIVIGKPYSDLRHVGRERLEVEAYNWGAIELDFPVMFGR